MIKSNNVLSLFLHGGVAMIIITKKSLRKKSSYSNFTFMTLMLWHVLSFSYCDAAWLMNLANTGLNGSQLCNSSLLIADSSDDDLLSLRRVIIIITTLAGR